VNGVAPLGRVRALTGPACNGAGPGIRRELLAAKTNANLLRLADPISLMSYKVGPGRPIASSYRFRPGGIGRDSYG
jgi:hypothetical protein